MKKIILGILLMLLLGLMTSCTLDLSKRKPYRYAIGKKFVLQKDFYIYYFNDYAKYPWLNHPCKFLIGTVTPKDTFFYNLPNTVEEKYIGSKNSYVTLEGILKKGTVVTIQRIVEQKTWDNVYYFYIISPNAGPFEGQEINPSDIVNLFSNPPYTQTWSDPPIFDPKAALPLPSDGPWWRLGAGFNLQY